MDANNWQNANGVKIDFSSFEAAGRQRQFTKVAKRAMKEIGAYPTRTDVAGRLTAARTVLGLSPSELADQILYDRGSYTKVEKGERDFPLSAAWRLYRLHGFSLDYIYDGKAHGVPSQHAEMLLGAAPSDARMPQGLPVTVPADPRYRLIQQVVVDVIEGAEAEGESIGAEEIIGRVMDLLSPRRAG
ncbi:MAG: helix-turn-helix transcriptional regulator [Pseudomonadota bacterium]